MEGIDVDKIVKSYLSKRRYDTERYNSIKDDPEFKAKNNARAKRWYEGNREKRQDYYDDHKVVKCAYQQFNYYRKQDRLREFVLRHPSRWKILVENNKLTEEDKAKGQEVYYEQEETEDEETGEVNPNFIYDD